MSEPYYYYSGQQMPLSLVQDACLVSLRKPFTGKAKTYFPQLRQLAGNLAHRFELRVDTGYFPQFIVLRGDPDRLKKVREHEAVHCLRHLYKDHNGLELALSDEVMVKFRDGVPHKIWEGIIHQWECQLAEEKPGYRLISVRSSTPDAPLWVANRLKEKKGEYVLYALPNAVQRATPAQVPSRPQSAPRFGEQWHLQIVGAEAAWALTCGDPAIIMALIDSGVDLKHLELKAALLPNLGYDFVADDSLPSYEDDPGDKGYAHGTACAGIIIAQGLQVTGIAPHCRVIPFRVQSHTFDQYKEIMEQVAQRNPHIISCSWHISENDPMEEAAEMVATKGRNGKGIPIFCAAGQHFDETNQVWQGQDHLCFPAALSQKGFTLAVWASTEADLRWPGSNHGLGLDFLAPGWSDAGPDGGILTTDVRGRGGYSRASYCRVGGTSLATPLAAGVAALMLSQNPSLTAEEVRSILRQTAEKINLWEDNYQQGWSPLSGYGRINALKAVEAVNPVKTP